jgi:hypothetical protein
MMDQEFERWSSSKDVFSAVGGAQIPNASLFLLLCSNPVPVVFSAENAFKFAQETPSNGRTNKGL